MIRYAPVSTTRTAIPRISTRSIFKILPGWSVTAEYTFDRKDVNYDFIQDRLNMQTVNWLLKTQ